MSAKSMKNIYKDRRFNYDYDVAEKSKRNCGVET